MNNNLLSVTEKLIEKLPVKKKNEKKIKSFFFEKIKFLTSLI